MKFKNKVPVFQANLFYKGRRFYLFQYASHEKDIKIFSKIFLLIVLRSSSSIFQGI